MTSSKVHITRVSKTCTEGAHDVLAVEEPLQIRLLYGDSGKEQVKNVAVTMRTPGNDEELAAGFLFTEGIIKKPEQLINITPAASGVNDVLAICRYPYIPDLLTADRNFYATSSCGVCGKSSIDAIKHSSPFTTTEKQVVIEAEVLYSMPSRLRNQQLLFHTTGGLHACGLFDKRGELIMLREDVGRHNALDKLVGSLFLSRQLPAREMVLVLSGSASFELVQKASMAGILFIAAIGAPSSLAVELATENGITLVGFLNDQRFNIYSCPERIKHASMHEIADKR